VPGVGTFVLSLIQRDSVSQVMFQIPTAASMKFILLWDLAPYNLVETHTFERYFTHHQENRSDLCFFISLTAQSV
jgi:hypothetical protein